MSDRPSRPLPLRERATRWVDRRGHPESPEQSMDPRPERMDADAGAALVDSAIYVEGRRVHSPKTLADTYRMFQDEPGVLKIGQTGRRSKRDYVTLRIPASTAARFYQERIARC